MNTKIVGGSLLALLSIAVGAAISYRFLAPFDNDRVHVELELLNGDAILDWDQTFRIVISNDSDHPVRIWSPDCLLGWRQFNVVFRSLRSGKSFVSSPSTQAIKSMSAIEGSVEFQHSSIIEIQPHDRFAFERSISQIAWGESLPSPNTNENFDVLVRFETERTLESRVAEVWSGATESGPQEVKFVAEKLKTPNDLLKNGFTSSAIQMMSRNPELIDQPGEHEMTPLHVSIANGQFAVVKWLLDRGVDVNRVCYNRYTPILLAEDPEIVQLLLARSPDLTLKGGLEDHTILQKAALRKRESSNSEDREKWGRIASLVMEAGAAYDPLSSIYLSDFAQLHSSLTKAPELATSDESESLLRVAARLGEFEVCEFLITRYQVDVDDRNRSWGTPIFIEALPFPNILKLLIDHGVDLKAPVRPDLLFDEKFLVRRPTAIHYAVGNGLPESVQMLLDAGLKVVSSDEQGMTEARDMTPIELAVAMEKTAALDVMLNHRAFLSVPVEVRQSILNAALKLSTGSKVSDESEKCRIVSRLLTAGARPMQAMSAEIESY